MYSFSLKLTLRETFTKFLSPSGQRRKMSSGLGDQREGLEMYLNTNGMEWKLKYK